jgi:hypothetical protein
MAEKQREREERGEAAGGFGRLTGPAQCAAQVSGEEQPACWADEADQVRRPSEPAKERQQRPSGLKLRRKKISISFSFSNISNAFSNSF